MTTNDIACSCGCLDFVHVHHNTYKIIQCGKSVYNAYGLEAIGHGKKGQDNFIMCQQCQKRTDNEQIIRALLLKVK